MILLLPLMVSLASSPGDAAPWQPTGQNVHGNDAPAAVAELVADAIAANRFWVFTELGASAVTTLMMVPAVCALAMLADLHHAAWLAAAA